MQTSNNILTVYYNSSVLIHEFGHTIMEIGIRYGAPLIISSIHCVYDEYLYYLRNSGSESAIPVDDIKDDNNGFCIDKCYAASNEQEIWACSVQVWLCGTAQKDKSFAIGIDSVDKLRKNLHGLYVILKTIFGESVEERVINIAEKGDRIKEFERKYYDKYIEKCKYCNNAVFNKWCEYKKEVGDDEEKGYGKFEDIVFARICNG